MSMQEHFNTFRPELQGVKNIKTIKNSDSYDVCCVRINKRHTISKEVSKSIKEELKVTKTQKDIAKEHFVSTNTVGRILKQIDTKELEKKDLDTSIIYIDEFKGNAENEKYQQKSH